MPGRLQGTWRRGKAIAVLATAVDVRRRTQLNPVAWTGTELVFSTGPDPLFSSTGVVRYNPTTGGWKKARVAPCSLPATGYTQIAWIGNRLVVPCGTNGLQIYSPRTDSWRMIKPGPSPLNSRGWSAIVWTGTDLIVWSDTVKKPGNPTTGDGASLALND